MDIHQVARGARLGLYMTAGLYIGTGIAEGLEAIEHRKAYPEGLVCVAGLVPGDSPGELANDSDFAVDTKGVVERSQFMNPQAIIDYANGDHENYAEGSVFNVKVDPDLPTDRPYFATDYHKSTCTTAVQEHRDLASVFPSVEAAKKIFDSVVAVSEEEIREDAFFKRRCGAIATGSELVLVSPEFADDENSCVDIGKAQTGDRVHEVTGEREENGFTVLTLESPITNTAEVDEEYVPKKDDVLIYCGYNNGGQREYFRVKVVGSDGGELMLRAGIDQIYPDDQSRVYMPGRVSGGSGGLFTPDGKLVAMLSSTAELKDDSNLELSTDEYRDYVNEYNAWLRAQAERFDWDMNDHEEEQILFAAQIGLKKEVEAGSV